MFENPVDQALFEAGHDGMVALLKATSAGWGSQARSLRAGMLKAFINEHRTNQQSFVRAMISMLSAWSEIPESSATDLRNIESWKLAKEIAALANDHHLPLI